MSNTERNGEFGDLPGGVQAKKRTRFSIVWLVPLVALLAGGWLVYKTFKDEGPRITLRFKNADGIEAGKTKIKFRDVEIGFVEIVRLARKGNGVVLEASLKAGIEDKITKTTRFWVVRPRIGLSGITGIGTLLSGAYITLDPGKGGAAKRDFVGLEEPPKLLTDRKGTLFRLKANRLGSLGLGSPVYFRDIPVGNVLTYNLHENHKLIEVEIFIDAPHDKFVYESSKFWNSSGVNLEFGSEGFKLELSSLVSLISGGVAFHTPPGFGKRTLAKAESEFVLYDTKKESEEQPITRSFPYLVYFTDSVRGLSEGAVVEFMGIRIGTVSRIQVSRDLEKGTVKIGALLAIEPDRLPINRNASSEEVRRNSRNMLRKLVERGMRAQLKTGNLLTGQLFIDFAFFPQAEAVGMYEENGILVVPSVPSTIASIAESVSDILAKLKEFPIDEIGRHAVATVAGVNELVNSGELQRLAKHAESSGAGIDRLINGGELQRLIGSVDAAVSKADSVLSALDAEKINQAVESLKTALVNADKLVATLNTGAKPLITGAVNAANEAEATLISIRKAASEAEQTLIEFRNIASEEGTIALELMETMEQLSAAARSIRIFAEYLEQNPQALLTGKSASN